VAVRQALVAEGMSDAHFLTLGMRRVSVSVL
jgi:hypothetical protein